MMIAASCFLRHVALFTTRQVGKCRNDRKYCEDCMTTDVSRIYNIHYNQCRKPWNCIGAGSHSGEYGKEAIPEDQVHLDHCMKLMPIWHSFRTDLETKLERLTGDESIEKGQIGKYKTDIFQGHCKDYGPENYLPLSAKPESLQRIIELYNNRSKIS